MTRLVRHAAYATLVVVTWSPSASAQPEIEAGDPGASDAPVLELERPPSPVALENLITLCVTLAPEVLDRAAFGAALAHDLDVHVALLDEAGTDVRVEPTEDGRVRLTVRRADGLLLVRETEAGPDPHSLAEVLALLAANLLRNESDELLALLRVEAVPQPPPPAETPPVPAPIPAPAPTASPEEAPAAEEEPEVSLEWTPVAIDFLPAVGFSSAFLGGDARSASFGILAGFSGRIDGVGMSSVFDLALHGVNGAQFSGVVALDTGDLEGLSAAGVASIVTGDVSGVQIGTVFSFAGGRVDGAQLGLINIAASSFSGIALGLVNATGGRFDGAALGLINAAGGETASGLQLGLVNLSASQTFGGAQLGLVNVGSGPIDGLQLGLVNIAEGRVRGLQLGLINVAQRSDASIGLVSVQRDARTRLRIGADTNGFFTLATSHGSGVLRSIAEASVEPFLDRPAVGLGVGLGLHAELADIVDMDIELLQHVLLDEDAFSGAPDAMTDLRAVFSFELDRWIALYVGVGLRLHTSFGPEPELGAPIELWLDLENDTLLRLWPTLSGGIAFF